MTENFNGNKRKEPLTLFGEYVILDEIAPKYFDSVLRWRNDSRLNRYLNQPYTLSYEYEIAWYEKYLNDPSQGYLIMIDRENGAPFGTLGWTDMNLKNRRVISGRILRGESAYKGTKAFRESFRVFSDYLYEFADIMYAHVVKENISSITLHERQGYIRQDGDFQYPAERFVNGMEQIEFYRTKQRYEEIKRRGGFFG